MSGDVAIANADLRATRNPTWDLQYKQQRWKVLRLRYPDPKRKNNDRHLMMFSLRLDQQIK